MSSISVFDDIAHYPGLTLDQPFGGAVFLAARGLPGKDIETRKTRITRVPSTVVICIGKARRDNELMRLFRVLVGSGRISKADFDSAMGLSGVAAALAVVSECRPLRPEDEARSLFFAEGRWAWVLGELYPLNPFPWRGCQGFSRVPREQVMNALERVELERFCINA